MEKKDLPKLGKMERTPIKPWMVSIRREMSTKSIDGLTIKEIIMKLIIGTTKPTMSINAIVGLTVRKLSIKLVILLIKTERWLSITLKKTRMESLPNKQKVEESMERAAKEKNTKNLKLPF